MWFIEVGLRTYFILKRNRFLTTAIFTGFASTVYNWSVGPRRPSDQSDAFVAGFLYTFVSIYLSIFLCLVVGFRPRFHGYHFAPSEGSCLKRQTTYQALTGSTDLGNV